MLSNGSGIGVRYSQGAGVAQDWFEAVRYFRKAAAQRHYGAAANLAVCYFKGDGVKKNESKAWSWFNKSTDM